MFRFLMKSAINNETIRHISTFHKLLSNSNICIEQLANGVNVVTEEQDSPLACVSLVIQTGSSFENSCNNGISNFIEHMAISNIELQKTCYDKCIQMNSTTTREYQRFSAVCPCQDTLDCIQILTRLLDDIDLNDHDIKLQKNVICSEAIDYDRNTRSLVFDYLHATAFQGTPLGQSVIGPTSNIANFDKNLICNFMNENYQPNRFIVVSSGNESHSSIVDKLKYSNLGIKTPNECVTFCPGPQRYTGSEINYRDDSMPYAHIAIAVEVPGYNSPEYLPLLVASCLSGSWDRTQGGSSRHAFTLARASSTSHLCERFESFYIPYRDVGLWGVYFIGDAKNLDDMVSNIQDLWMQLCVTTDNSDVIKAVNTTKFKLAKRFNGVINSCYDIGLQMLHTSKAKSLTEFYSELENIKHNILKDVCYKYLYDKCPAVAACGPTESLPHYNRIRSGMYWMRL